MLPAALLKKYCDRLEELILAADEILKTVKIIENDRYGAPSIRYIPPREFRVDNELFVKWRVNCVSVLQGIIPPNSVHRGLIDAFGQVSANQGNVRGGRATLQALKNDLEKGFLEDISGAVESEIAGDYMGQAEQLLSEGQSGKFDHVPAAVLTGAILERALRTLCERQSPKIPLANAKGEPKTLNPLIDDLKKAGAFTEMKAKQLRGWAAIRNHAAHGEFDLFTRSDVEQLLHGVKNFLADHL